MNDQAPKNGTVELSHFAMALSRIDGGGAILTADEALRQVMRAVRSTGKKGAVNVTLEIAPNGETGFLATARVTSKIPMANLGQAFFYSDANGNLTREAPGLVFKQDSQGGGFIGN